MHPSETRSQRKKNPNLLTIAHLMTTSISHIGSLSQLNKEGVDPRSASKSINTTWSHPNTLLPCEELVVYRGSHFSLIEENRHSSSSRVLLHWWVREQEQDQGKSFILAREKKHHQDSKSKGFSKAHAWTGLACDHDLGRKLFPFSSDTRAQWCCFFGVFFNCFGVFLRHRRRSIFFSI